MPGEPLEVDTDKLTREVFRPFTDYVGELVEWIKSEAAANGPLVPGGRQAELDDYVIDFEKKNVPLTIDVTTGAMNIPTSNGENADFLRTLLDGLEGHNTKQADSFFNAGPHA